MQKSDSWRKSHTIGGTPVAGSVKARQLALDLPVETRFGVDDFLVAPSNEQAWEMIGRWPDWPASFIVLQGPAGSGKSHLGSIWAQNCGAITVAAAGLSMIDLPKLAAGMNILVEDASPGAVAEQELFHLINSMRENGGNLLLTSRFMPAALDIAIPDLLSRLRLAPVVAIAAPDDGLVKAVLVKLFHDRQLSIDIPVIDYIATRIERSLGAVRDIVDILDQEALSRGRAVTRPMAAEVLRQL